MAVDQFLILEGVQGETMDKEYSGKKACDILSFGWGVSNTGTFHQGSGGGAGKANFQDITITKFIDKASAPLMLMCANGKHIPKGEIIVRKAGEKPLNYFKISMEKILVSSYSTGGSSGEERLTENVTLNFASVKVEYFMQNDKGGSEPGGQMAWNIAANAQE
jgi:type VI secretion system secreted protein Hcp